MIQSYRVMSGIEIIIDFYLRVLAYGMDRGLDTNNISIWLHPQLINILELEDYLSVKYKNYSRNVPVISCNKIREVKLNNGQFRSNILIGDPTWSIE